MQNETNETTNDIPEEFKDMLSDASKVQSSSKNYEEYLGEGYVKRIRQMLAADETLLPDAIINAEINIGAMKLLISPVLEKMQMFGKLVDDEIKFKQLSSAALYYLAGILCVAMKSRTSAPPFNIKKYKKEWDKKRNGYMQKGNYLMMGLMRSE